MARYRNPSNTIPGHTLQYFKGATSVPGAFESKKPRKSTAGQTNFCDGMTQLASEDGGDAQLVLAGIAFEVCSIRGNNKCKRYPEVLEADKLWAIIGIPEVLSAAGVNQVLARTKNLAGTQIPAWTQKALWKF
jgi:hypothetical protein